MRRYLLGLLVGLVLGLLLATTPAQALQYERPPEIIGPADTSNSLMVLGYARYSHEWALSHGSIYPEGDTIWVSNYSKIIRLLQGIRDGE